MNVDLEWLSQKIYFAITSANRQAKLQEQAKGGDASINDFEIGKVIAYFDILNAGGEDVKLWGTDCVYDNGDFEKINSIWVNGKIINVEKGVLGKSKFISEMQDAFKKGGKL